jgi:hypothetical protein
LKKTATLLKFLNRPCIVQIIHVNHVLFQSSAKLNIKYSLSDSNDKSKDDSRFGEAKARLDIIAKTPTHFSTNGDTEMFKTSADVTLIIPDQAKCLSTKFIRIIVVSLNVVRASIGNIDFYDLPNTDNFIAIPVHGYLMCKPG